MTDKWEGLIINLGYELEMKTKDSTYPLDYENLLNTIYLLEKEIKVILAKSKKH